MGCSLNKESRAWRNINWIEKNLRIPKGKKIGQPFVLYQWQREFLILVYDNPHTTRLAILSIARKNGKTALAAALLMLHFIGPESKRNADMYSAARTRDQAALVFDYARRMIQFSPELGSLVNVIRSRKELQCDARGTTYRALSADATGAFGLNPSFILHDELGQVRGQKDDLYDALETSTGEQEEPLSLVISTQAATDDDLLSTLIDDAQKSGDKTQVCMLYAADGKMDDPFTYENLKLGNPGLEDFMNPGEVCRAMAKAKRLPDSRVSFMNLQMNVRISTNAAFITRDEWDACKGDLIPMAECAALYAGLDLSRTRDLTACVVIGVKDDIYYVYPKFWLPEKGLRERSEAQIIPYFNWNQLGYLDTTPGKIIDRRHAADFLYHIHSTYTLQRIAYDAWDYTHILKDLQAAGFADWQIDEDEGDKNEILFEKFRQGYFTMSPALRTVEQLIVDRQIVHSGNPVLDFNMANCVVLHDTSGNRKLDKSSAKKTIDGAIAMVMGLSIAHRDHADDIQADDFNLMSLYDEVPETHIQE